MEQINELFISAQSAQVAMKEVYLIACEESEEKDAKILVLENKVIELEAALRAEQLATEVHVPTHISAGPTDTRPRQGQRFSEEQKMAHFKEFLKGKYQWINKANMSFGRDKAEIPWEFILDSIKMYSGTNTSRTTKALKGLEAYWPSQLIMTDYLTRKQKAHYPGTWRCSSTKSGYSSYNGSYSSLLSLRYDLKKRTA